MAAWTGFSDEDLRRMKGSPHKDGGSESASARRQAAMAARRNPRGAPQRKEKHLLDQHSNNNNSNLDPSMKLSRSQSEEVTKSSSSGSPPSNAQRTQRKSESAERQTEPVKEEVTSAPVEENRVKELDYDEARNVELHNVKRFQQQQKVIEESNKHKRQLLAKAIDDRRKKAKAEADKLIKVQQELDHLDSLLTADVSIIRNKIEAASLEYMEAQKRYEKAEKEFIAAKMNLYEKCETKEHLTEHLYTIIHQNEVRKAKKLVSLMEKLAMEITPEEMELSLPVLPQLTQFTAVSTLHRPGHEFQVKGEAGAAKSPTEKADGDVGNKDTAEQTDQASGSAKTNTETNTTEDGLPSTEETKSSEGAVQQDSNTQSQKEGTAPAPGSSEAVVAKTGSETSDIPSGQQTEASESESSKLDREVSNNPFEQDDTQTVPNETPVQNQSSQENGSAASNPSISNGVVSDSKSSTSESVVEKQSNSDKSASVEVASNARGWKLPFS